MAYKWKWWVILGLDRNAPAIEIEKRAAEIIGALKDYQKSDKAEIVAFFGRAMLAGMHEKNALPAEAKALWLKMQEEE